MRRTIDSWPDRPIQLGVMRSKPRGPIVCLTAALVVTLLSSGCAVVGPPSSAADPGTRLPTHVRVRLASGVVRRIPLEEYVRGTIISEVAPNSVDRTPGERMLEVQAIVARSYAVANQARHGREGYDLCATTHCQLYQPARLQTSSWRRAANEAAERTSGQVLWFKGSPASALFHADCGGQTSAGDEVWGGTPLPYLVARKDDGPAGRAHATWRFEVSRDELVSALNADGRTRVGRELAGITVVRRDEAGRAALVALKGTHDPRVRGEELRAVLMRAFGARSIRSTRFEVERSGSTFVFKGSGFGHGVGLCQAGALARLRAGARPDDVLDRYFPGTRVVELRR
jgi:stage II sporulation protein D